MPQRERRPVDETDQEVPLEAGSRYSTIAWFVSTSPAGSIDCAAADVPLAGRAGATIACRGCRE